MCNGFYAVLSSHNMANKNDDD